MKFNLIKMVLKWVSFWGVLCILTTPVAFATVWDLAADFSGTSNPNVAWSFGWENPVGGSLTLYNTHVSNSYGIIWYDSGVGSTLPAVWKDTVSPIDGVKVGEVSLHPGYGGQFSVVRWTAPSAGQFSFDGSFDIGDTGYMSYYIYDGTLSPPLIQSWSNASIKASFDFTQTMTINETIDFIVGPNSNGSITGGNTPLELTITSNSVPEPATMLLLGLGLMGLAGVRRKFQK